MRSWGGFMNNFSAFARPALAWFGGFLLAAVLAAPTALAEEQDKGGPIPAMILKVEGDGTPKVKKAFGVEEAAGAGGKVFPGDRVITDDRSAVFLLLNDGSVLKVGLASEFKLETAELNDRFLSWAFRLVKGTMRALVEKSPDPDTRVRIHTPSGTVGVRGTEFVVAVDEESKMSFLYTIEGLVAYGPPDCEKHNTCTEVRAGEMTSLQEGQKDVPKPRAFEPKELFSVKTTDGGKPAATRATDSRMSLFQDAKRVTAKFKQDMEDEALKELVREASESLAAAQDRAIGRTKAQRAAMHNAIKDGSYRDILAAADAFAEKKDIFFAGTNDGAENLVAQTAAAKFRLGAAVKEAKQAGVFGNVGLGKDGQLTVKWKDEKFELRKNLEYDKATGAKTKLETLNRAADNYRKVLEFAEAHPAPKGKDKGGEGGGQAGSATQAAAGDTKKSVVEMNRESSCRGWFCRFRAMRHEIDASTEGVVNAFAGTSTGENKASSFSAASNNKGEYKTEYFRKAIPGDSCFREEKDCKMVPCKAFYQGKKCKKGESLQECTTKKVPVRCAGSN